MRLTGAPATGWLWGSVTLPEIPPAACIKLIPKRNAMTNRHDRNMNSPFSTALAANCTFCDTNAHETLNRVTRAEIVSDWLWELLENRCGGLVDGRGMNCYDPAITVAEEIAFPPSAPFSGVVAVRSSTTRYYFRRRPRFQRTRSMVAACSYARSSNSPPDDFLRQSGSIPRAESAPRFVGGRIECEDTADQH
jgi:hypothetical protein